MSRLLTCVASNSPTYKAHVIWLQQSLDETFHAQALVVGQTWHRFVRKCYREIAPIIKKESTRGRLGKFGTTTLMSYAMAGRVMYTFKRGDEDLTFVADESDMQGFRAGPNASITPYLECVSMINEVVEKWDLKKMKVSEKVGLG